MAGKALKKLNEQLNCAICLDTFAEPKILQCFHIYCKACLIKLVVRDQQQELCLLCPTCRKPTPVPDNGVSGLQSAFHIDHLLELRNSFEEVSTDFLDSPPTFGEERMDSGLVSTTADEKAGFKCSEHSDKELELFCENCQELICLKCVVRGGKHYSHEYDTLDTALSRCQEEVMSALEPVEKHLNTIDTQLSQLDTRCEEICNQRAAIEDNIHNTFRQLHEILDVRKTELISELHQMTQSKLKGLAAQRDQIETTQAKLNSSLDSIRKNLKNDNEEILKVKNTMLKQVKELTATYCQVDMTFKPNTEADITFSTSSDISILCPNYGKIALKPDPSKCYMKDMPEEARVGDKITALLQAVNSKNEPCEEPIRFLKCELVSELSGSIAKGRVERRGENQYEISYQPTMKGRYQLHIKAEGHHIKGSPFTVVVKAPVEKLGTPIQTIPIECPVGVAVHQNGEIITTCIAQHCVTIYNLSGEELRCFGTHGSARGQFDLLSHVVVDNEGNILIADMNNHRIQKFAMNGDFLVAVGTMGSGPLQFNRPYGITFNPCNNKVYVVDKNNNRIQVLNSDLTFSSTFGKYGSGRGQFNFPCAIACDSTGKVYVADSGNHRIQVFTAKGEFLRTFGKRGQGKGELYHPVGIAISGCDKVCVSEEGNHRVSVFTCQGQFQSSFGKEGKKPGEFNHPYGLAVDSSGVVYVCDAGNCRIQLF